MRPILDPATGQPIEINGYGARWNAPNANGCKFKPGCFYLDRDPVLNLSHDFGLFATLGDGALSIWSDKIGLAFCLAVTTDNVGALNAVRGGAFRCSVQWDQEVRRTGADGVDEITGAALVDICLTDAAADPGAACWVNLDSFRDMPRASRSLHSAYYRADGFAALYDSRTASTGRELGARPLARRPSTSASPAAAARRRA